LIKRDDSLCEWIQDHRLFVSWLNSRGSSPEFELGERASLSGKLDLSVMRCFTLGKVVRASVFELDRSIRSQASAGAYV
jgi:hypothetical protein